MSTHTPSPVRSLLSDQSGDAAVEYVILVGTVAIVALPALILAGVGVVVIFENMRNLLAMPIP